MISETEYLSEDPELRRFQEALAKLEDDFPEVAYVIVVGNRREFSAHMKCVGWFPHLVDKSSGKIAPNSGAEVDAVAAANFFGWGEGELLSFADSFRLLALGAKKSW